MSTPLLLVGDDVPSGTAFCGMVGRAPAMLRLFQEVQRAAPLDTPVLIEGATGTGKELVARALHTLSARRGAFVAINVATLTESLADTELFGAVRGAYTGATGDRQGLIEAAAAGTLFLDEAGDMPLPLQAKLLRALESGVVRRVGHTVDRAVRFRLLVSVQESPGNLVASGRWRADFYFRVAGIALRIPSLQERRGDVLELVNHFLTSIGRPPLDASAAPDLEALPWPGQVRQVRRAVERAAFEAGEGAVTPAHITRAEQALAVGHAPKTELRDMTAHHVAEVLRHANYDTRVAAARLGLSRSQLYRKLQALGIRLPSRE